MARMIADHRPRRFGENDSLVTRQAAAYYLERHPDQISRHCEPVACDVDSRLALYSLRDAYDKVATLRKRRAA